MKILYVITGLGLGGAERVTTDLADKMVERGHQVKIAYLTGELLVRPKNSEIEIIALNLNGVKDFISASLAYQKLIKTYQPDVVHSHMIHANIFTRLNRLFCNIPKLISTAHSSNEGGKLRMLAYRLTHKLADISTNVSKNAVKAFEDKKAVPKGGMMAVYNGINLDRFKSLNDFNKEKYIQELDIEQNKKFILAVGRLTEPKDYPNLIQAVVFLKNKTNAFKLLIAGEGDLRSQLEQMIEQYQLHSYIQLLGSRSDIPELMNLADIYVLSSKYEGLPTVLIEAMACEKFIVATNCGGSDEILGETGILVPTQNSQLLANGLEKALSLSPLQIKENGEKARLRAEELFYLESSVNKWLEFYERK